MADFLDPNTWDFDRAFRMYAGETADVECLVDEEDYLHFTKWLWVVKRSPCGKLYLRRAVSTRDVFGVRVSSDTIYLHIEICRLANGDMPTRTRCIADHLDGNSLNNRRDNLRWATKRENNRNRFGAAYHQRSLNV